MINLIIGIIALLGALSILWCIYFAQELDNDFQPLKPCKTVKDLWDDTVKYIEGLNNYLFVGILTFLFFLLVYLINKILFQI